MKTIFSIFMLLAISTFCNAQSTPHEAAENKYGEPGKEKLNEWMNGHVLNAKIEPEYNFPVSMVMHITDYKNGEKRKETDIKYFINSSKTYFGTKASDEKKKNEMFMIYDYTANAMIMLNEKEKTGMAININAFMSKDVIEKRENGTPSHAAGNTSCSKTGKTKNIQGYPCEEYVCIDKERNTRSEIWITNKVSVNIAQSGARGPWAAYFRNAQGLNGMMMEANFYKEDKLETTMQITNINEKENMVLTTSDYKLNQY